MSSNKQDQVVMFSLGREGPVNRPLVLCPWPGILTEQGSGVGTALPASDKQQSGLPTHQLPEAIKKSSCVMKTDQGVCVLN